MRSGRKPTRATRWATSPTLQKLVGRQILRQYRHGGSADHDAHARPSRSTSSGRRRIIHDYPDEFMGKDAIPRVLNQGGVQDPEARRHLHDHRPYGQAGRGPGRHRDACTGSTRRPSASRSKAAGFSFAGESKVLEQSRRPARHPGVRQVDPRPHQPVRLQVREAELGRLELLASPLRRRQRPARGRATAAARR